jgi:hypothetical protein
LSILVGFGMTGNGAPSTARLALLIHMHRGGFLCGDFKKPANYRFRLWAGAQWFVCVSTRVCILCHNMMRRASPLPPQSGSMEKRNRVKKCSDLLFNQVFHKTNPYWLNPINNGYVQAK